MKKIRNVVFVIVTFLLVSAFINVKALDVDKSKRHILIKLSYGELNFANAEVFLYQVGDIDEENNITYFEMFDDNEKYENLTASEIDEIAKNMYSTIQTDNIEASDKLITNNRGEANFYNIKNGLYLVKAENVIKDNYEYITSPQLLLMPMYDEMQEEYSYEYAALLKIEAKDLNSDSGIGGGNNNDNVPNTLDAIMLYVSIFVVALVGIIIVIYYIKKQKRKEEKNEKTNEKNN